VLNSDEYLPPPEADALSKRLGGVPVYADGTGTRRVGLMVDVLGFVPNAILPQLAEMKACYPEVEASFSNTPGAALSPSCKTLYLDAGWNESFLDGHGYNTLEQMTNTAYLPDAWQPGRPTHTERANRSTGP
jgi:hypothetical protein